MKISSAFPSKYLKAADIPDGREVSVQIDGVRLETMENTNEDKPVLYFVGKQRGLVLNVTNSNTISDAYGEETDSWHNQPIVLFGTTTEFGGKRVPCVRVKVPHPQALNGSSPPIDEKAPVVQEVEDVTDGDDIPF